MHACAFVSLCVRVSVFFDYWLLVLCLAECVYICTHTTWTMAVRKESGGMVMELDLYNAHGLISRIDKEETMEREKKYEFLRKNMTASNVCELTTNKSWGKNISCCLGDCI